MRRRGCGGWLLLAVVLGVLLTAVLVLEWAVTPVIAEYAVNQAQYTVTRALDRVVLERISADRAGYGELVRLERDNDAHVTALHTDVLTLGAIKATVVDEVYRAMRALGGETLEVPLGSVLAPAYLSGRGPVLRVRMSGLGSVHADFISAFTQAGINQTRHNILLEVRVEVRLLLPLAASREVMVSSRYPLTDTVLVGSVPENYTYIDDTEQSLLGRVNDYAG